MTAVCLSINFYFKQSCLRTVSSVATNIHKSLREGFQKNTANCPHFVDKGGGSPNVDKRVGWGGCRMWMKKFLNVNIINFENGDKPEGGGRTMWIGSFC